MFVLTMSILDLAGASYAGQATTFAYVCLLASVVISVTDKSI